MNLTEGEQSEPLWWCNHHKQSVKYLVLRIDQLLNGTPEERESISKILKATLPNFAESVGVSLNEIKGA
tara:strand:- start:452 stop:658 length:207 start_codon:yes stop_codon:yes gene_type:complete